MREAHEAGKKAGVSVDENDDDEESDDEKADDDSSSDDQDDDDSRDVSVDGNDNDAMDGPKRRETQGDGKGITKGWADSAREYKKNHKDKHRRHRGIMQWKVGRMSLI